MRGAVSGCLFFHKIAQPSGADRKELMDHLFGNSIPSKGTLSHSHTHSSALLCTCSYVESGKALGDECVLLSVEPEIRTQKTFRPFGGTVILQRGGGGGVHKFVTLWHSWTRLNDLENFSDTAAAK